MMGVKARLFGPMTNVSLEDLVPQDHFYRHLDQSLDLAFVRDLVEASYAVGGRPSIDPVVFFQLHRVMFFAGLRSERQRMRVAADRLSIRWYLGYDLHQALPDHSSLTNIRDRYGVPVFRRFFDRIIEQCQQAGIVWGKERSLDSTQVEANADNDKMVPRCSVDAMHAHLAALFPEAEARAEEQFIQPTAPPSIPLPVALPLHGGVDVALINAARHNWMAALGRPDRTVTRGDGSGRATWRRPRWTSPASAATTPAWGTLAMLGRRTTSGASRTLSALHGLLKVCPHAHCHTLAVLNTRTRIGGSRSSGCGQVAGSFTDSLLIVREAKPW